MGFLTMLKARWRAARNPELNFEAKWNVTVLEDEVSCTRPNGKVESLKWDDLEVLAVETTDEGPFVADVFWYLAGKTSGFVVPLGATGEDALLKRLQALPGFDNEMLSTAMASTSNQRFILWRRDSAT
jgi:hypothetical protein